MQVRRTQRGRLGYLGFLRVFPIIFGCPACPVHPENNLSLLGHRFLILAHESFHLGTPSAILRMKSPFRPGVMTPVVQTNFSQSLCMGVALTFLPQKAAVFKAFLGWLPVFYLPHQRRTQPFLQKASLMMRFPAESGIQFLCQNRKQNILRCTLWVLSTYASLVTCLCCWTCVSVTTAGEKRISTDVKYGALFYPDLIVKQMSCL